jgi:hypothetical protein
MIEAENEVATMQYDVKESILYINIRVGCEMTKENLVKHYSDIRELTKGERYFAVIDVSNYYSISDAGMRYAATKEALEKRAAVAYFNPCLANKISINFLKVRHQIEIPFSIFESRNEALKWIEKLKNKN